MIALRPLALEDITQKYVNWLNDPEVTQYSEQRFRIQTKETILQYAKKQLANPDVFFWAILRRKECIGSIKLAVNRFHHRGEISLLIGREYWGKGYGTEAVRLVVEYAFKSLGLHKLTAGCYEPNHGSRRIFEKNGFRQESTYVKEYLYEGEYIDAPRFSLFRKEEG